MNSISIFLFSGGIFGLKEKMATVFLHFLSYFTSNFISPYKMTKIYYIILLLKIRFKNKIGLGWCVCVYIISMKDVFHEYQFTTKTVFFSRNTRIFSLTHEQNTHNKKSFLFSSIAVEYKNTN